MHLILFIAEMKDMEVGHSSYPPHYLNEAPGKFEREAGQSRQNLVPKQRRKLGLGRNRENIYGPRFVSSSGADQGD